eukprot:gnl/Ergobibamus_cyprinoides/1126.p1 GENE.gnl/Ergobibamus_cyprinoides/1126~~gnl/Ergobibamus_cyprinoides/1126.p1  ORF type:complete len:362 (+),score=79.84 gnl/Ergobibamus_cyprinoides/1126:164-1087(+)
MAYSGALEIDLAGAYAVTVTALGQTVAFSDFSVAPGPLSPDASVLTAVPVSPVARSLFTLYIDTRDAYGNAVGGVDVRINDDSNCQGIEVPYGSGHFQATPLAPAQSGEWQIVAYVTVSSDSGTTVIPLVPFAVQVAPALPAVGAISDLPKPLRRGTSAHVTYFVQDTYGNASDTSLLPAECSFCGVVSSLLPVEVGVGFGGTYAGEVAIPVVQGRQVECQLQCYVVDGTRHRATATVTAYIITTLTETVIIVFVIATAVVVFLGLLFQCVRRTHAAKAGKVAQASRRTRDQRMPTQSSALLHWENA